MADTKHVLGPCPCGCKYEAIRVTSDSGKSRFCWAAPEKAAKLKAKPADDDDKPAKSKTKPKTTDAWSWGDEKDDGKEEEPDEPEE